MIVKSVALGCWIGLDGLAGYWTRFFSFVSFGGDFSTLSFFITFITSFILGLRLGLCLYQFTSDIRQHSGYFRYELLD